MAREKNKQQQKEKYKRKKKVGGCLDTLFCSFFGQP
jgi:hypothetical protein